MKKPAHIKHTMNKPLLFVGLDVHAQQITVAVAEAGRGEARLYGTIPNDLHALERVITRLRKAHPQAQLDLCYEAGPTGFVLARRLTQLKLPCSVVAPSLIPSRSGDRIYQRSSKFDPVTVVEN
jgi:transposase